MRLTKKKYHQKNGVKKDWYEFVYDKKYSSWDRLYKLGQLEDIEEELGIDLTTLFKALNNKIYTRLGTEHYVGFDLIEQDSKGSYLFNLIDGNYYFKDYGKTWALTKEELIYGFRRI